jgi:hypothetical protein
MFDEEFVRTEWVVGQPAPNSVSRYGPTALPRKFLKDVGKIATAPGLPHLVPYCPKVGEDVITAGWGCPGCEDNRPGTPYYVSATYPDHQSLRASHPELVHRRGAGVRFYHSVASCPYLWRKVHRHVRANPDRVDLFEHIEGAAPTTLCLFIPGPIERTGVQ